jgi:quercetin dioxygenase-like cupin family protein
MEFFRSGSSVELTNPGVVSEQLLSPHNSASSRVTITRVTMQPRAVNSRHRHATSEQIWIGVAGAGMLLLADGVERPFKVGDIVRFADGDTHGARNDTGEPFAYISVTSPPINFDYAYKNRR